MFTVKNVYTPEHIPNSTLCRHNNVFLSVCSQKGLPSHNAMGQADSPPPPSHLKADPKGGESPQRADTLGGTHATRIQSC